MDCGRYKSDGRYLALKLKEDDPLLEELLQWVCDTSAARGASRTPQSSEHSAENSFDFPLHKVDVCFSMAGHWSSDYVAPGGKGKSSRRHNL